MTNEGLSLLIEFSDQSESYVHGFEAGSIHAPMKAGEPTIDHGVGKGLPIHTANLETLTRMAAAYGYEMETEATDYEEWTAVRFTKRVAKKPSLALVGSGNPHAQDTTLSNEGE